MALSRARHAASKLALQGLGLQQQHGRVVMFARGFSTIRPEHSSAADIGPPKGTQQKHPQSVLENVGTIVPELHELPSLQAQFEFTGATSLVPRKLADELLSAVKEAAEGGDQSPILLEGEKGSGKSALLMQLVHWCRTNGWLVLYSPAPKSWVLEEKSFYYGTMTGATLSPSVTSPGSFGQPLGAQYILEAFVSVHREQLKEMPVKREYDSAHYVRTEMENSDATPTLFDLANAGMQQLRCASDALTDLRYELSLVTEVPVLVAVDEYNSLHWPSCFHSEGARLTQDKLQLSSTFRFLDDNGDLVDESLQLKRGITVGAMTNLPYRGPPGQKVKKLNLGPFDRQGFMLDKVRASVPARVINVPCYTNSEFRSAVESYLSALASVGSDSKVAPPKPKSEAIQILDVATARVPGKVFDVMTTSGMPKFE